MNAEDNHNGLLSRAVAILNTSNAREKARLTAILFEDWRVGDLSIDSCAPPLRPARPFQPKLLPPNEVPRRRGKSPAARAALLHALAHIELNAIDLALDIICRFAADMPDDFTKDWMLVARDEALHFLLICQRLETLGYDYGSFDAHDGLWDAAIATKDDLMARLAVVPMVLEARGLDVTPQMIKAFDQQGLDADKAVLNRIYVDEITHVAAGKRWFSWLCARDGLDETEAWQALVMKYFRGTLKRPFNEPARTEAGMPRDFYEPVADMLDAMRASGAFKTGKTVTKNS